jgi:hypothetical protein
MQAVLRRVVMTRTDAEGDDVESDEASSWRIRPAASESIGLLGRNSRPDWLGWQDSNVCISESNSPNPLRSRPNVGATGRPLVAPNKLLRIGSLSRRAARRLFSQPLGAEARCLQYTARRNASWLPRSMGTAALPMVRHLDGWSIKAV